MADGSLDTNLELNRSTTPKNFELNYFTEENHVTHQNLIYLLRVFQC